MSEQLSRLGLAFGALGSFAIAGYIGHSLTYVAPDAVIDAPTEEERKKIFDKLGKQWDNRVKIDEAITGINALRRSLARHAFGNTLEVAAGSGRNLPFYDSEQVSEVTLVDFSREMLEASVEKKKNNGYKYPVHFKLGSASSLQYDNESFDTVMDTFGICSFESPETALKEMARVLKPGGKMLLMEHGKSNSIWFQNYLARTAESHVHRYGCYCDRDIFDIVKRAADKHGLTLKESRRMHFGTTYYYVLEKTGGKFDAPTKE